MANTLQIGNHLARAEWLELQKRAIFDFCKWDIQCEDHCVLAPFPLLLEHTTAELLNREAEALANEALQAETEILRRPQLLHRLGLPRAIRKVLKEGANHSTASQGVRVMRFDFHPTPEGWRISEVNADVPGGFVEASGWNSLFAKRYPGTEAPQAPSEAYAQAIRESVGTDALVGFVHATAYSDDRQVMQHLARCFSKQGLRTCLLSPAHLVWKEGRAQICAAFARGTPDALVRFFPAEWLPNLPSDRSWKPYFRPTKTQLSNPGTAIVLQTKRFPLIWDELRTDLPTWRRLLPETRELVNVTATVDDSWVLKPALGRVGEGVGIRGITPLNVFQTIMKKAKRRPENWVMQRRFAILPLMTETGPKFPCIGVFTINGKAAGFYGRIADSPIINQDAQDAAVLILSRPRGKAI